ncbi:MAG: serine hydrolase family protein [Candidatus Buchananbacteria bacterium]|nr:serine hydrolase family protein [Candidatus Buchananbacteria bacterium]
MKSAIIIHGSYGNPDENWFPWLSSELKKIGYEVIIPKFPSPENQSLESWQKVFESFYDKIGPQTILIGHSLGVAFILTLLESLNSPIKATYLVSGFIGLLNNPEFDEINKTFVTKKFDWEKIKQNSRDFYIFHSDNDPYVPFEKAEEIADNLGIQVTQIKGAGHFNQEAGYTEFKELLDVIKGAKRII